VRSRQSSLYRAQQLAEFTLYDNDPELFNTDLQTYLDVTAEQIRDSVAEYLDTEDRVLLDIVPAAHEAPQASPQEPGDPDQPTSPLPQIPASPDEAPPGSPLPTTSQPAVESN
jgi:hypothetical protein